MCKLTASRRHRGVRRNIPHAGFAGLLLLVWYLCTFALQVGYLRHDVDVYDCPLYHTTFRGPTYVVLTTLKTIDPAWKWTLAGVAMLMQTD